MSNFELEDFLISKLDIFYSPVLHSYCANETRTLTPARVFTLGADVEI